MKHIHFTGICGVATAPIAKMFKDMGWKVTGSDSKTSGWGPIADFLKENNLPCILGYSERNLAELDSVPDLLVQGGSAWSVWPNPEIEWAKKNNVKVISFPEALRDFLIKPKSVVVAGTYGKTTISALLTWILKIAGKDPSFMTGAVALNFKSGVENTKSDYSVVEGDEHPTLRYGDELPKFMYYKPKYTIITSTKWDHLNVFPTEKLYIDAFRNLAKLTMKNKGILLLNSAGENNEQVKKEFKGKAYTYMLKEKEDEKKISGKVDYLGEIIEYFKDKTVFRVYEGTDLLWEFETSLIGEHNVENCVSAIAMARILGIDLQPVEEAIKTFKGIKRRQEIRGKMKNGAIIIDDLAHSPVKVKAALQALRTRYKEKKIIAVFDPHASSLANPKTLSWYPGKFDSSDLVIIPKVVVKKSTPKEKRIYGLDIVSAIKKTNPNVEYIPIDQKIIEKINKITDENTVIVFMSSGSWRGIIEELLKL